MALWVLEGPLARGDEHLRYNLRECVRQTVPGR